MPQFDGTGPNGQGPMTGRCRGFCIAETSPESAGKRTTGYAGSPGRPVSTPFANRREEAIRMPRGDGTGPAGMGPMTGRAAGYCAGYQTPGYMNPGPRAGAAPQRPFGNRAAPGAAPYYGAPYGGAGFPRGRGGFGRGAGRGRGRGGGRGGRGRGGGPGFW